MTAVGMQGLINQMRALAAQAGNGPAKPKEAAGGDFGQALRDSLDRINDLQSSSRGEAQAFQVGAPGVSLQNVMVDMQEANLAFQMGVQVRNRLVNAYKEVMNMPV